MVMATAQWTQTPPQIDFVFHAKLPRTNPDTMDARASGHGFVKWIIM
jgi:hypothetical protein